MKRAILPALAIALILTVPALPQGGPGERDMAKQVADLTEIVSQQQAQLQAIETYLQAAKKQAASLRQALDKAEKGGFILPAPNVEAKKTLLKGLQDYAKVAAAGVAPKAGEKE